MALRGVSVIFEKKTDPWVEQENGALRDMVCRSFMLELHRSGHIVLPPKQRSAINNLAVRKYLISTHERPIACMTYSSTPRHIGCRDRYIGWSPEVRAKNLHLLAYNSLSLSKLATLEKTTVRARAIKVIKSIAHSRMFWDIL